MKPLTFAWGVLVISLLISLVSIAILPADLQLPIHWNALGESDEFTNISFALLSQPIIMLVVIGVFIGITYIEPRKENLEESKIAREWIAFATVALMAVINLAMNANAHGYQVPMNKIVLGAVMLTFMIVGNFLSKTRSNFFIGIRTPWTLSNDEVWRKTHRFGGRLFMIVGLLGLLSIAVFDGLLPIYGSVAMIIIACLASVIYSWLTWRALQ